MIEEYIARLSSIIKTGVAREHAYRAPLEQLFESLGTIDAINDPARSEHGNPDFIFFRKNNRDLILGYAETKDIYVNLDKIENSDQLRRYFGYSNLILTNYLEFRFFKNGEKYQTITVGKLAEGIISPNESNFNELEREVRSFLEGTPQSIKHAKHLAEIMGGKAARIRSNVIKFLNTDSEKNQELLRMYKVIQKLLLHDLEQDKFADMYAQTLVYGLFVARYYDETPESFSRQEARDLIPASNPFLQHFFDHIAGPNFDKRLQYIVDELCEVFSVSDIQSIIQKHYNLLGESTDKDPIIHFYEDFLKEYDPELRKRMGAYYTPVPVVNFIIKAVDEILKNEFNLPKGIADTTKIERQYTLQGRKAKEILDKVQILDPAVGTATFLNETIKFIHQQFKGQEGLWKSYVEQDLLTRLYGFEIMMAPYTIAHLKLAMTLKETGIDKFNKRLGVYLTNTLEEGFRRQETLFDIGLGQTIAEESERAANIKTNKPIMVILGNPPYSGISSNETPYANRLIERYKVEPGGKIKLQERKHWLNDDYVKFIAFAESMIEKTGDGIVAMITNNGYLDNPTFRGMRWHIAKTFEKIYIYNLHGSIKKHEATPDGIVDENVFDIMQGVSIIVAIKTGKKKNNELGEVYYADLYGMREHKFSELAKTPIWKKLTLDSKMLYYLPKNNLGQEEYNKGFRINELFLQSSTGILTMGDSFITDEKKENILDRMQKLCFGEYTVNTLNNEFKLGKNYAKFVITNDKNLHFDENKIIKVNYRPFDNRWTYFDNKVIWRWRESVMKHMLNDNLALGYCRQVVSKNFAHIFLAQYIMDDSFVSNKSRERGYCAPLYLYSENGVKSSNLKREIVEQIENIVGETEPEDIFDYIYACLYSPAYREKFKEFLKIDFPRIPYPKDEKIFKSLVLLGRRLRQLHLLEDTNLSNSAITYSVSGENLVDNVHYTEDKVFINDSQFFGNVPKTAWEFYIGGYQPAQKWLKDRKGRKLSFEDIVHYQKIIKVLVETDKIMKQIDNVYNITH